LVLAARKNINYFINHKASWQKLLVAKINFTSTKLSLPCSKEIVTDPYTEPHKSRRQPLSLIRKNNSNSVFVTYFLHFTILTTIIQSFLISPMHATYSIHPTHKPSIKCCKIESDWLCGFIFYNVWDRYSCGTESTAKGNQWQSLRFK